MKHAARLALVALTLGMLSGCGTTWRSVFDSNAVAEQSIADKKSIYFDFDSAAIREKDKAVIKAHADYMFRRSTSVLTLKGAADNGGAKSPDLALANRRAEAVRAALISAGADAKRIRIAATVENVAKGGDPTKSRRVDFLYQ